jgi:hypothetical protein
VTAPTPQSDPEPARERDLELPRTSFWEHLPPRALVRVVALLVILAVVIYLQARSSKLADSIGKSLFPPAGPAATRARGAPPPSKTPPPHESR